MSTHRLDSSTSSIPYPSSEEDERDEEADADNVMDDPEDAEDAPGDDPNSIGEDLWNALPPRHLKEISSLATWTVSSSKPGCGIAALRANTPKTYWQSDGPQPHHLNIHFFKLVRIVHMRFYVDAALDESYTPRKLHLLAGTGLHDLREVCTMLLDAPRGWVDADLSRVGGPPAFPDEPSLHASVRVRPRRRRQPHWSRGLARRRGGPSRGSGGGGYGAAGAATGMDREARAHGRRADPAGRHTDLNTELHDDDNTNNNDDSHDYDYNATAAYASDSSSNNDPHRAPHRDPHRDPHDRDRAYEPNGNESDPDNPNSDHADPDADEEEEEEEEEEGTGTGTGTGTLRTRPKVAGGTLLCFLVQLRVSENHQNGKDTHLRGLQVFARDEEVDGGRGTGVVDSGLGSGGAVERGARAARGREREREREREPGRGREDGSEAVVGLRRPAWAAEAVLR